MPKKKPAVIVQSAPHSSVRTPPCIAECRQEVISDEFEELKAIMQKGVSDLNFMNVMFAAMSNDMNRVAQHVEKLLKDPKFKILLLDVLKQYKKILAKNDELGKCYKTKCTDPQTLTMVKSMASILVRVFDLVEDKQISKTMKEIDFSKNIKKLQKSLE